MPTPTPRVKLTAQQAREQVQQQLQSGLSIQQYCQQHGINPSTFYNWHAKYKTPSSDTKKSSVKPAKPQSTNTLDWLKLEPLTPSVTLATIPTTPAQATAYSNSTIAAPEIKLQPSLVKLTLPGGVVLEIRTA